MEYIEIILKNVQAPFIIKIIAKQFQFNSSDMVSSHFYSSDKGETLCFSDIKDWNTFFCGKGTSDMFFSKIEIGIELKSVVVLIDYNASYGDITINFPENQLYTMNTHDTGANLRKLFLKLLEIGRLYKIDNIIIGYEPAEDHDMKIIEILHRQISFFNKDNPSLLEIQMLHQLNALQQE